MEKYTPNARNRVRRIPKRGHYDKETVFRILDTSSVAQVGFATEGQPFIIPTIYGRDGETLYLHGASTSRMMNELAKGLPMCLNVTHVDGIVLARSLFHSSMNYRSVVVFGTGTLVSDKAEKLHALEVISEQILPGRWGEARQPTEKELKATAVVKLTIESASAKIRTGPPGDDKADYELPIWAGVLPFETTIGAPIPDPLLKEGIDLPQSILDLEA